MCLVLCGLVDLFCIVHLVLCGLVDLFLYCAWFCVVWLTCCFCIVYFVLCGLVDLFCIVCLVVCGLVDLLFFYCVFQAHVRHK